MKKGTLLTVTFILVLLFLAVVGAQSNFLVKANPYGAEFEYTNPPVISIISPVNNETCPADVVLQFTVAKPDFWLKHGGNNAQQILKNVKYQIDGNFSRWIPVNSDLDSPFEYYVNLKNLTDGFHSMKVYAYASGWVIEMHGLWEYEVAINSSSTVYFTVDSTSPTISILSVENKTNTKSDVTLNFTVNEPVSQITYSLDEQKNVTVVGNTTLTNLPFGEHNLTVYATDNIGNIGASETLAFTIAEPSPFPPTIAVAPISSVVVIGIGLLVYFKKRLAIRDKHE